MNKIYKSRIKKNKKNNFPNEIWELIWDFEGNSFYKSLYNKVIVELMTYTTIDFVISYFNKPKKVESDYFGKQLIDRINLIKKNEHKEVLISIKELLDSEIKEFALAQGCIENNFIPFVSNF